MDLITQSLIKLRITLRNFYRRQKNFLKHLELRTLIDLRKQVSANLIFDFFWQFVESRRSPQATTKSQHLQLLLNWRESD